MKVIEVYSIRLALISAAMAAAVPGFAQGNCGIDWGKLNLSSDQSSQIQTLESQWNRDYMQLQPAIVDDQRKLQEELAESRPDPVEVMTLQQSIARKQEQLRAQACANYLRKRQCLSTDQQHQLENMIHQVLAERKRTTGPSTENASGDGIQYLWRRVQTIWTRMGQ